MASDDSYTRHGNGTIGPVLANDSDPDGDRMTASAVTLPSHGSLSGLDGNSFYYTLSDTTFVGTDSFTYRACDPQQACSNIATVTINVVNQPPVANNDAYTVHVNGTIGPLRVNDSDPDGDSLKTPEILTFPSHGTLFGLPDPDKKTYSANQGYVGPDSFTYRVCDSLNLCSAPATVTVNVVNQLPVALDDAYTLRGGGIIGPLLVNDYDPDGDSLNPAPEILTFPSNGTLYGLAEPDKKSYTPTQGFAGTDSFTYRIRDDFWGYSSPATVTLTVLPNDGLESGGAPSCHSAVGEPINVTNGNMYLQQSDYQLPGVGPAINVTRAYNSTSQRTGVFGKGWSSDYDEAIQIYSSTFVRWFAPDGQATNLIRPSGSGSFIPVEGDFHSSVVQNGDGSFTVSFKDGSVHRFSSTGKLLSLADRNGNQTSLSYDINGRLISVTDPFGRVLTITPDANGRVLSISDSIGTAATYAYGASGELLSVTYPDNSAFSFSYTSANGNLVLASVTDAFSNVLESHTYDAQGRALTSEKQGGVEHYGFSYISDTETDVTDALGHVSKYFFDKTKGRNVVTSVQGLCSCGSGSQTQSWTYDNQLNVISHTNALGQTATYVYDANGNKLSATGVLGTSSFTYNQFGEVLTATDAMNGVTTNTYDVAGNLLSVTDALNKATMFTYDPRGELLTMTNALGKVTTLTWDTSGRLTQAKDALNNTTSFGYDARARLTSATDALNFVTSYAYDAAGQVNKITRPDLSFVTFTYDLAGRRTKVTDALNNSTTFAYDGAYRLTGQTDALLKSVSYTYDLMSNLTGATDQLAHTTNIDYDEFNRPIKTTYPPAVAGGIRLQESVVYDAVGNVTQRTDTAGRVTNFTYDDANRLTTVTDPFLQLTSYEYNARSNVTAVVDPLLQRYTFDYDALGRVTATTRAGMMMGFAYDAVGNRIQRTDYNNMPTSYTYDALNRLTKITYPDATTATYAYDKLSHMTSATNLNGTVSFVYDSLGRAASTTDVWGQMLNYTYDANDRRTKMSFGATTNATYTYDVVNRLTKITDSGNLAVTFAYDAASRLTSKTLPNGVAATYTYDDLDRLTRLKDAKGNTLITDNNYTYNNAGQITQNIDQTGTHVYGYDALDRLTSATYTGSPNESYAYDGVGNRTSSHKSASYTYQPFNRLTNTTTANYIYNNNGNLISKTEGTGTTQFQWDFENRLVQVVTPSAGSASYKYDALGRRIQRVPSTGVSTNFIYDDQDVVKDINSDGTTAEYLNGPGVDNKIRQKSSSTSTTYYFSQDHLGSTTALTGTTGKLVERISYDAYGNSAGSTRTRYGFTGRERDSLTGLLYYRARSYDPQIGRFISEDPIGFAGGDVNIYAYVSNNPSSLTDPTGQWSTEVHKKIIDEAFAKCLDDHQLFWLKEASAYVDGGTFHSGAWMERYAYQHGMRAPNQSIEEAKKLADGFISGHLQAARNLAPQGCKSGAGKISADALWEFGQALHTITDMTSPAHAGFQIWYGPPVPTGLTVIDAYRAYKYKQYADRHAAQETLAIYNSDPVRRQSIINAARDAFKKTFGECGCCS